LFKNLLMRITALLITIGLAASVQAQQAPVSPVERYAELIKREDLRRDLEFLASDALEGRDTGERGQKMAAAYIRQQFIDAGIPPVPVEKGIEEGYYQPFDLVVDEMGAIQLRSGGRAFRFMEEILYFDQSHAQDGHRIAEVVYLGDGTDLKAAGDLKGRAIWVHRDDASPMGIMSWLRGNMEGIEATGASTLLVSTDALGTLKQAMGRFLLGKRMRLPHADAAKKEMSDGLQTIFIDANAMAALIGSPKKMAAARKKKPGRAVPVDITVVNTGGTRTVRTENVLAYIEGTEKKDELVIITAHYDHEGVKNGEVFNGADDNGSGTVAVMAIARAFAQAKADGHGPLRSVLVMLVTGEEKGLLGSRYYSEEPVFPLENTVANLNIDMIGRVDSAHRESGPYVYVIGSDRLSSDLHAINEQANTYVGLDLDYRFNAADDPNKFYYRSDHYNFARKGVPAIFYFSGVHPDYHTPADTVDKIRFDLVHKRALLVFHTAWELANRPERIVVDKSGE
jgi:hypothetical protein